MERRVSVVAEVFKFEFSHLGLETRMVSRRFAVAFILLVIVFSTGIVEAQSAGGTGTVELSIGGDNFSGNLTNAFIHQDDAVTMVMNVDYTANSNVGQGSVTGTGYWYGIAKGVSLEGVIYGVRGAVKVCYVFYCGTANYVGYGTWRGTLTNNRTEAAGTFRCTLAFTSSQIQQIPLNKPMAISGTWNSTLQASA